MGVNGVRKLDGRTISADRIGPVTTALGRAYQAAISGEMYREFEWTDTI